MQKKFWRHQHKRELNFPLCCLLLTTPSIDTACHLRWSILIKFAIETRENSLTYFFNFTFQQFPCAKNLCCYCRCDKFSLSVPAILFVIFLLFSQALKVKWKFPFFIAFFLCLSWNINFASWWCLRDDFRECEGRKNGYIWEGHGSKGKWLCRASR